MTGFFDMSEMLGISEHAQEPPGVLDRLANAWHIFTASISFILKDKSLLAIPIILFLSTPLLFILFTASLFSPIFSAALILNFILLIFVIYIWTTFLSAAQSWMVHEVAQGKDATLLSGLKRAIKNFWDITLFSLAKLLIGMLVGSLRRRGGYIGHAAGSFIELVTGIAGKLVLPAMIVTERNFIDAIRQLGKAIKAIPEIAAFEIGIRPLTGLLTFISIGLAVLFGLAFGIIAGIITFVILYLTIIIFSVLINQVYYTLLYLTLIEKKKVHGIKLFR